MAIDQNGSVYVSGGFEFTLNFGSRISLTNPFNDAFVAKYNSSGAIQWARQVGAPGTPRTGYSDLALEGQGNAYVVGLLNSNAAISKYAPDGTLQWTYLADGQSVFPATSAAAKCAIDSGGNCLVSGIS